MKFRNQARLCLAVYHFEAHIMRSLFFKILDYRTSEKFNSNAAVRCKSLYSHFSLFIIFDLCRVYTCRFDNQVPNGKLVK